MTIFYFFSSIIPYPKLICYLNSVIQIFFSDSTKVIQCTHTHNDLHWALEQQLLIKTLKFLQYEA